MFLLQAAFECKMATPSGQQIRILHMKFQQTKKKKKLSTDLVSALLRSWMSIPAGNTTRAA